MLNEQDLKLIRDTREQITHLRTVPFILHREGGEGEYNPLTGETTKLPSTEEPAEGTWSNLTTGGPGTDDITMVGGVLAESGDAIVNLDVSYDVEGITHIEEEDGRLWRVRSMDTIGLGGDNRHYVLLRRVT